MVGLPGEARSTAIVPKGGEAQRQLQAGPGTTHTPRTAHPGGRSDRKTQPDPSRRPARRGTFGYTAQRLRVGWLDTDLSVHVLGGSLAALGSAGLFRKPRETGESWGRGRGAASRLIPAVLSGPGGPPLPLGPQGPRLTRVTTASRGELEGAGSRPGRWQAEGGGETLRPPGLGWPGSQP